MKIKFNLNKIICTFCLLNLVIAQQIYSKRTNQFQASAKIFTAQSQGTNIAFEVCFNSDTFARPSREEYTTFVESNQYWLYRVRNNILNLFNSPVWTADMLHFNTYYGASGGQDMELVSGMIYARVNDENVALDIGKCWKKFSETDQTNNEVRLFSYQLKKIYWNNNKYTFIVEPVGQGLQILHYRKPRQTVNSTEPFPIEIVDTKGNNLGKCDTFSYCEFKR